MTATLAGMAKLRAALNGAIYGVLGNHDTICLVPGLEDMGIKVLLNESETIERGGERIHLAGIDDAHFYRDGQYREGGRRHSRTRNSPSSSRTRRRSTGRRPTPTSISC